MFVLISVNFMLYGQRPVPINKQTLQAVGKNIRYFKTDSGAYTPAQALLRFKDNREVLKGETDVLNLGLHKETDTWLLLRLVNQKPYPVHAGLLLNNLHLEKVFFYEVANGAPKLLAKNGDWVKQSEKRFPDAHPSLFLEVKGGATAEVLIKILKDKSSVRIPLYAGLGHAVTAQLKQIQLRNGLYLGFLTLSLLLSLSFFALLRTKLFLLYSLYVLTTTIYTSVNFGFALEYIYPETPFLNDYLRAYMAALNSVLFVLFSLYLLNLKTSAPTLYKIIFGAWLSMVVLILFSILFNNSAKAYFNPIYSLVYVLMLIQIIGLFFAAVSKSKKFYVARVYLFAYFMLITGTCLLVFREIGAIQDSWLISNLGWTAMALEVFILILALAYKVRGELLEKLKLSDLVVQQQKSLFTAFFNGREEERKILASTLHDGVAGNLLAAQYRVDEGEQPKLHELLKSTFEEVRQISHDLYPPNLKEKGLEHLLQQFKERYTKFSLSVEVIGKCDMLPLEHQLLVFRIAQELLNNCSKHANASNASLLLNCSTTGYSLKIEDNGVGISPTNHHTSGIGIKSIHTRINKYPNASFLLKERNGGGTLALLKIPLS